MFAVVETGGKQYRVKKNDTVEVEKLPNVVGEKVILDRVLLMEDIERDIFSVGRPFLKDVSVEAELLKKYKAPKVTIFKMRRRKNSRRKSGHRQEKMKIRITNINIG